MNISENFLTKEELQVVNKEILQNDFPWYPMDNTLKDKSFPMMTHILIERCDLDEKPISNSNYSSFFETIVKRFCKKYKIKFNRFLRASLNLTMSNSKYSFISPHVDHRFKHNLIIIYLEDCSGDTIIFDRKYTEGDNIIDVESLKIKKLKILKKIKPKQGKVMICDGSYFHTYGFCKHDEIRRVGVFTFI
tara:strand:+ start:1535 stop:2107 length:573 start_codon:yes stop_codon:yes gene_type:complete